MDIKEKCKLQEQDRGGRVEAQKEYQLKKKQTCNYIQSHDSKNKSIRYM